MINSSRPSASVFSSPAFNYYAQCARRGGGRRPGNEAKVVVPPLGAGQRGPDKLSSLGNNHSLVPRLPPLTRNYCVTFELVQKSPAFLHEFKGHAIIARKGGEPGNEAIIIT